MDKTMMGAANHSRLFKTNDKSYEMDLPNQEPVRRNSPFDQIAKYMDHKKIQSCES